MIIPKGANIAMPRPMGDLKSPVPTISHELIGEGPGELITVQFVGEIGPISQFLEFIQVLDMATEADEIRLMIDSPGGDVYTAQHLVERMGSCKAKITTVASGLVASAATFVWCAGDQKEVGRWGRFMFHSSLHGDWGKSLAIKETATELVNYMASILTAEQRKGILLAKEVLDILDNKANVEISGAAMRARLVAKAKAEGEGEEGAEEEPAKKPETPEEPETEEEEAATPDEKPVETDEDGKVVSKKAGKKKVSKKRKAEAGSEEGEEASEEEQGKSEGEEEEGKKSEEEGEKKEGEGEEADAGTESLLFDPDAIFRAEGIEDDKVKTPETQPTEGGEETTSEKEPEPAKTEGTPEAKCGGGKKKVLKKKKGEEDGEVTPSEENPEQAGGEEQPAEETGAAEAKCGGKKKAKKKALADIFKAMAELLDEENADSGVEVTDEPESAKPEETGNNTLPDDEKGEMKEAGQTEKVENPSEAEVAFDPEAIYKAEGVEEEEEKSEEGEEKQEGAEEEEGKSEKEEGEESESEKEEAAETEAKKGAKKKVSKKRKAADTEPDPVETDEGTTEIASEKSAEEGSNVEKAAAPAARYW